MSEVPASPHAAAAIIELFDRRIYIPESEYYESFANLLLQNPGFEPRIEFVYALLPHIGDWRVLDGEEHNPRGITLRHDIQPQMLYDLDILELESKSGAIVRPRSIDLQTPTITNESLASLCYLSASLYEASKRYERYEVTSAAAKIALQQAPPILTKPKKQATEKPKKSQPHKKKDALKPKPKETPKSIPTPPPIQPKLVIKPFVPAPEVPPPTPFSQYNNANPTYEREPINTSPAYRAKMQLLHTKFSILKDMPIDQEAFRNFTKDTPGWRVEAGLKESPERTYSIVILEKYFSYQLSSIIREDALPFNINSQGGRGVIQLHGKQLDGALLARACTLELYGLDLYGKKQIAEKRGGLPYFEKAIHLTIGQQAALSRVHLPRSQTSNTHAAHIANIRARLGIQDVDALAVFAYKSGYIDAIPMPEFAALTHVENIVAQAYANHTRAELTEQTGLPETVIKTAVTSIYRKFGISTRRQLILALLKYQEDL